MSRSFVAIALFSFMALAQAATLVKDNVDVVITVRITEPNAQTTWVAGTVQEVTWCAVSLRAPFVTVPSRLLRLIAFPL
jgi:hypothetical protein